MKKLISILLIWALVAAMVPIVFAENGPSDEDLKAIGSKIEKPKEKEYLDNYVYASVKAPGGHSVYGYGSADRAGTRYEVMDGEWVVVLAERGEMSCCIVLSEQAGRWISSGYLLTDGREPARPEGPNAMDLKDIKSHIEFPKDGEYLEGYEYAVVKAPKGHSVFGYGAANRTGNSFTVLDGEEVMILAAREGMSCCIVLSDQVGRWINSEYLEEIPAPAGGEEKAEKWVQLFYGYYYPSNSTERRMTVNEDGKVAETMIHTIPYSGPETLEIKQNAFDREGRIVRSETRDAGTDSVMEIETWTYDEENRVLKILTRRSDGTVSQEQNNIYADNGRTIEVKRYDDNEILIGRSVTVYDADGNSIREESYDADGRQTSLRKTSYDAEGRKTGSENTTFITSGENYTSVVHYEYDQKGLLVRSTEEHITGYYAGKTDITTYTYDAWGNELEEVVLRDGELYSKIVHGWGLLKAGEITEMSGQTDFDSFDPAAYTGEHAGKTYGRISFAETEILNHDGVRVTAVSYSADGNSEAVHFLVENTGDMKVNVSIHTFLLNDKSVEPLSFYSGVEAHDKGYSDLRLSTALLQAAGIARLESISVAMDVQKDYKTVYTSDTVRIPVQDRRTRFSSFVPMNETLISEDLLKIQLVGYDIQNSSFDVYYTIENHLSEAIRLEGNEILFNGQAGSPYGVYETAEAKTSSLYLSRFYNASYGKLDAMKDFEFSLLLEDAHYSELGKIEHLYWEFDAEENLSGFSASPMIGRIPAA